MTVLEKARELFDGIYESDMNHLKEISSYNHNYYNFNGYLLFGLSDDDNFTQWYWIRGTSIDPIAGSYTSDNDQLIVDFAYT